MIIREPVFMRDVARIVDPEAVPGNVAGHRARRLIDGGDATSNDPFVLMAEDWMPRGAFSVHPHRGIETVTFVIEGSVEHSDSAGHGGIIHTGDAQWMTAGRGIQHEENAREGTIAHTLQLWVNLPAAAKMTEPRYQDLPSGAMPVRREAGVEVRVFSGKSGGVTSPTLNHVPVTMLEVLIKPGASFSHSFPAGDNAFVHVLEGDPTIGAAATPVLAGQLAWLTRSETVEASELTAKADSTAVRLLFFAGGPLREPIALGGPFVMNTHAEVRQAFTDFRAGRL